MTYCITTDRYEDFMFVLKILHDVTQFQSLYYENFNLLVGTWDDDIDIAKQEFANDAMVKFVFADDLDIYSFFKRIERMLSNWHCFFETLYFSPKILIELHQVIFLTDILIH